MDGRLHTLVGTGVASDWQPEEEGVDRHCAGRPGPDAEALVLSLVLGRPAHHRAVVSDCAHPSKPDGVGAV